MLAFIYSNSMKPLDWDVKFRPIKCEICITTRFKYIKASRFSKEGNEIDVSRFFGKLKTIYLWGCCCFTCIRLKLLTIQKRNFTVKAWCNKNRQCAVSCMQHADGIIPSKNKEGRNGHLYFRKTVSTLIAHNFSSYFKFIHLSCSPKS